MHCQPMHGSVNMGYSTLTMPNMCLEYYIYPQNAKNPQKPRKRHDNGPKEAQQRRKDQNENADDIGIDRAKTQAPKKPQEESPKDKDENKNASIDRAKNTSPEKPQEESSK